MTQLGIAYFTAPWCTPCKTLLPKVRHFAEVEGFPLQVVDVDRDPWHVPPDVKGVPTIQVTVGGELVAHLGPAMASISTLRKALA